MQQALAEVSGVQSAAVSYEESKAVITVDAAAPPTTDALISAVKTAGYTASAAGTGQPLP